jgi:RNA recognition motif-containing protein
MRHVKTTFSFIFLLQDIDIKKVNGVPQYAFVQYSDIASVCKAIKKMDGEYLGSNRLKVKEAMVQVDQVQVSTL